MARRNDHSREELQAMAIQAAVTILEQEGLPALSTRKVAQTIGYTVGTLYLVFRNLDDLLLQVNATTLEELRRHIAAAASECGAPQTCLKAMAQAYLQFARQHRTRWGLLFSHRLPGEMNIPDWFKEKVNAVFAMVREPLQQLQTSVTEVRLLQATSELWSGVHGICALGLSDKLSLAGEVNPEQLIESFVTTYLSGYLQE